MSTWNNPFDVPVWFDTAASNDLDRAEACYRAGFLLNSIDGPAAGATDAATGAGRAFLVKACGEGIANEVHEVYMNRGGETPLLDTLAEVLRDREEG